MRTSRPARGVQSIKMPGADFTGINKHDSIGKLEPGDYLELVNVDIEDGYVRHRRGTEPTEFTMHSNSQVKASITFVSEDTGGEVTIIESTDATNAHRFSTGATDYVKNWGTTDKFPIASPLQNTYIYANGKVYMIGAQGNYVFEIIEIDPGGATTWLQFDIWARPLGIPKLQIESVTKTVTGSSSDIPEGKYVYAVEMVRKKEGTSASISSSSPNRFLTGTSNFAYLTVTSADAYATSKVAVSVNSILASPAVTHVRLWRSKNLLPDPDTFVTAGAETEIFLIDEVTQAVAVAPGAGNDYEFSDFRADSEIPNTLYGSQSMSSDGGEAYFEWEPMPAGYVGEYYSNRMWIGHIVSETTGFINDNSNIAYGGPADTLYNELYDPLNGVIQCESGDGHTITKLKGMSGDLVVFKQNSTGRVPNAQPLNPYEVLDESVGIAYLNAAEYVSRYGVMGITNDQDLVQLFDNSLQWSPYIGSVNFSRKLLDTYEVNPGSFKGLKKLFKAVYWEGKVVMHIGEGRDLFVLNVAEGRFWSQYHMPYGEARGNISGSSNIEMLMLRDGGKQLTLTVYNNFETPSAFDAYLIAFKRYNEDNQNLAQQDLIEKDPSDVYEKLQWSVMTAPFQHEDGRSVIEHRYLSVMAAAAEAMNVSVYVCNLTSRVGNAEPMALDPTDYTQGILIDPPAFQVNQSAVVEYQYYAKDKYPYRTNFYGERLIYWIKGEGYIEMYPPDLYCRIKYGQRPPDYNFSKYLPSVSIVSDMVIHLTRTDMTINIGTYGGIMPPETV